MSALSQANKATDDEIRQARELYGSDEIEIDDNAAASRADEGIWVAAWVWLSAEDREVPS